MKRAILVFLTIAGLTISAYAQPANLLQAAEEAKQRGDCDETIRILSQFIASRVVMPKSELANAYNARGYCYFDKGDSGKAISDYTAAIKLSPKDADAYNLRGWAHFVRGEIGPAIADSTTALRLDPKLVFAMRNRGRAQLYMGRPKLAVADFVKAVQLAPGDAAGVLWLAIARFRAKEEDRRELEQEAGKIDHAKWPAPLVDVYLGASTPEEARSKIDVGPEEKARREAACDADVYLGFYALATEDKDEASRLFTSAVENCPVGAAESNELAAAKMEAKHLRISPAKSAAQRRPKPNPEAQQSSGD